MVYFDEVDHLHRFVNQVNEVRAHKSGLFNVERILIVNNGFESSERLKDILPVGVTLLDNPHRSLACARQMIIDHCNEDFILCCDPDCEWTWKDVGFLYEIMANNRELVAIAPKIQTELDFQFDFLNAFYKSPQGRLPKSTQAYRKVDHLPFTFILMRRQCITESFQPMFKSVGEDLEWGLRMTKKHIFGVTGSVQVRHLLSPQYIQQMKRFFKFGYIQALAGYSARRIVSRWLILALFFIVLSGLIVLKQGSAIAIILSLVIHPHLLTDVGGHEMVIARDDLERHAQLP